MLFRSQGQGTGGGQGQGTGGGQGQGTGGGQGQGGEQGGQGMDAMDAAFADDGGDKGTPPPTDDPMGAAMDQAAAESDAKEMPADGGKEDSVGDAQSEADDGIPKEDEDDKSVGE